MGTLSILIVRFHFGVNIASQNRKSNAAMMKRVLFSSAYDRNVINLNLQRTEQHCT